MSHGLGFYFRLVFLLTNEFWGYLSEQPLPPPFLPFFFFLWLIVREMSYVQLEVPSLLWVWDQGYLPQAHISSSAGAD